MLKKFGVVLLLMSLIIAGCGLTDESQTEEKEAEVAKTLPKNAVDLVGIGDSLTVGVGDEKENNGYVGRFADSMVSEMNGVKDVEVIETAKKGRRSDQLVKQIKSGVIDDEIKAAEFITLTIGGNDLMKILRENIQSLEKSNFDSERPKFEKRYKEIFTLIRELNPTAPIVAIGVYDPLTVYTDDASQFQAIVDEWNSGMKKVVEEDPHAVFVLVDDLFVSNKDKVYSEDFFHPNAKGYTNMNNRIIETLKTTDVLELSGGKFEMKDGQKDE